MELIVKIIFLFLAVWFSVVNIGRLVSKEGISWQNYFVQSVGITGFIVLQFLI